MSKEIKQEPMNQESQTQDRVLLMPDNPHSPKLPTLRGSPAAKASFGSLPSPIMISSPSCRSESLGSEDSSSSEEEASSTGSSSSILPASSPSEGSNPFSEPVPIANSADQKRLRLMYGRKRLASQELNLNLDSSPFKGTPSKIDNEFGIFPLVEESSKFPHLFELHIIGLSAQLQQIICNRLKQLNLYLYSGALLQQANLDGLGMKRAYSLTLKVHLPSFGADTEVKTMLFWMNFEETSQSPIYSDGSTGTRSIWRIKEQESAAPLRKSGSRPISTRGVGTQT